MTKYSDLKLIKMIKNDHRAVTYATVTMSRRNMWTLGLTKQVKKDVKIYEAGSWRLLNTGTFLCQDSCREMLGSLLVRNEVFSIQEYFDKIEDNK